MCVPQPTANSLWIVSPANAQHLRGEALASWIDSIFRWLAHRRALRALTDLDDRLLADVGMTRSDVDHEMAKAISRAFARRHMK